MQLHSHGDTKQTARSLTWVCVALCLVGVGLAAEQEPQLGPAPLPGVFREAAPPQAEARAATEVAGPLPAVDTSDRDAVAALYTSVYLPALAVPADWTGSVASCTPGTTSAAYADATIDVVNFYRVMTGLPGTVVRDAALDVPAQAAALMMSANGALSHSPPASWACYTATGASGAGTSNLALGAAGPRAITLYIDDPGSNNGPVGHRRWILHPPQVRMGTGSTSSGSGRAAANALHVFGGSGPRPSAPAFVAWPSAGYVPYPLMFRRWSFSPNATGSAVNLRNATVTMSRDGTAVALTVLPQVEGYGDDTIAWEPSGLTYAAGMNDQVISVRIDNAVVNGVTRSYTYDVIAFDPAVRAGADTDADTLPDSWETTFGLNPSSGSGRDGATGDPDGDGRTNAQEHAAGTHPTNLAAATRYLSEGASSPFFSTRLAIFNPEASPARVNLRYLRSGRAPTTRGVVVPALGRVTIDPAATLGAGTHEFSTELESDRRVVLDRTMWWDPQTAYGAHAETALTAPAPTWYLAEGSTNGFNLFYLLQNPSRASSTVRVRYLRPVGAPIEKTYTLPAASRTNIWVNGEVFPGLGTALAATDVSAVISVTSGAPIIVERAMYLDLPGQLYGAGHESAGVTAPATEWFLAEGATGAFFDLFVLIANPGDEPATVEARFLRTDGTIVQKAYTVAANSRFNIWVDGEDARLADTAVSTTLTSTNGVPIIVERAMWWPGGYGQWTEAHNSPGSTVTGTRWALADGQVGGSPDVETYVLVANTAATPTTVRVTLYFDTGGSVQDTFTVAASSRFDIDVRDAFPGAAGKAFSTVVESLDDAAIVVERAMYWNVGAQQWGAGTNALATRLQ